jgi:hypothetical protein
MNTPDGFNEAQREVQMAESAFEVTERQYFERRATTEALRQAWDRRDRARREFEVIARWALEQAHLAAGAVPEVAR